MFDKIRFAFFFVFLMWVFALVNLLYDINQYGIIPRELRGLIGVLLSPLLHASLYKNAMHIINNSIFLLFLLPITLIFYKDIAYKVFVFIILVSGLLVWLFARSSNHIGASTLIFGLLSFLLLGSIIRRNFKALLGTLSVFIAYSFIIHGFVPFDSDELLGVFASLADTFIKGIDPRQGYISWEGHLFGAISGVLAAILLSTENKDKNKKKAFVL